MTKYECRFFLFSRFTLAGIFCSVQQMNKLAEIKMKSLDVSFIIQQISESLFYIVSITCWRCSKEREAAGINGDFNVCFSQLYYGVKIEYGSQSSHIFHTVIQSNFTVLRQNQVFPLL